MQGRGIIPLIETHIAANALIPLLKEIHEKAAIGWSGICSTGSKEIQAESTCQAWLDPTPVILNYL